MLRFSMKSLSSSSRSVSAVTDVANKLEHLLFSGKYSVGERLPTERELQTMFQVGRGTIREAVRILEQKGWVDVRRGVKGGIFVAQPNLKHLTENMLVLLQRSDITLEHLIEFRQAIDEAVIFLIMKNYTPEQAKLLMEKSTALAKLIEQPDTDIETIALKNMELSNLLSEATNNPLVIWLLQSIKIDLGYYETIIYSKKENAQESGKGWIDYVNALLERDIVKARYFSYIYFQKMKNSLMETIEQTNINSSCNKEKINNNIFNNDNNK